VGKPKPTKIKELSLRTSRLVASYLCDSDRTPTE